MFYKSILVLTKNDSIRTETKRHQLNKLRLAAKNATNVITTLSSNIIGTNKTNFHTNYH